MLKVGIVGAYGPRLRTSPSFLKCPESKIVAICDTNETLAKQVASKFDIPVVCKDYHDLLDHKDIDVVDVCSSANSHFPVALKLSREENLLCAKSLSPRITSRQGSS